VPELPEVEAAAAIARRALLGRTIAAVSVHHPAQRRALPARDARRLVGRLVVGVERHAKHQHIVCDDGARLAVHFRMNGDWDVTSTADALPRFARLVITLTDGHRLALVDSRALCSATYHAPGRAPVLDLGPEPDALTVTHLRRALARRGGPIKPLLLDQRIVAGLGNIYAAEALWRARIDPAQSARTLDARQLGALVRGIKSAIADGFRRAARYRDGSRDRPFKVYDREGKPCPRCGTRVTRLLQAGRSTYWCSSCQRPSAARPAARVSAPARRSRAAAP
jgi:formamidopyrimidine-DNA glycosylase